MEQENKYYTPDVENIRYGYEMEWLNKANESSFVLDGVDVDTWTKWDYEFQGLSLNGIRNMIADKRLRVLYLTKEQIEELGWKEVNNQFMFPPWYSYEKGLWSLGYNIESHQIGIMIKDPSTVPDYPRDCGIYRGECKSINELKYIMKLLKIPTNGERQ